MQIWMNFVLVVQLVAALAMIGLVLVQHGKGADMGASFGSGASGSLFGATGSANFLSRSTGILAAVFFVATLGLAYSATAVRAPQAERGVMGTMQKIDAGKDAAKDVPAPATKGEGGKAGDIPK